MNERAKKILVIVLFLGSVVGIAAALYFVFFRPAPTPTIPSVETPQNGSLPTAGVGGTRPNTPGTEPGSLTEASPIARGGLTTVTSLTTGRVEDVNASADGQGANYYDRKDGRFYTIDANGNVTALSNTQFPEVEKVSWDRNGKKAVLEFPDGSNVVYDFGTNTQVTLPAHWEDFAFSPVSDELAAKAIGVDPNNRYLVTANADGSNVVPVQALGSNEAKVQVAWSPNDQVLAFADTASPLAGGLDRKMILPIGFDSENFRGLVVEGLDFTPLWAPDGRQLIYSVIGDYGNNKPLLWTVDATSSSMGENRHSLGINTWADKCTFGSSTELYCAVPQNLPPNVGIQRALAEDLPDTLYKVDLSTGRSTLIAVPETDTTMTRLTVSADGSHVFFTNGQSGRLQTIRLN